MQYLYNIDFKIFQHDECAHGHCFVIIIVRIGNRNLTLNIFFKPEPYYNIIWIGRQ